MAQDAILEDKIGGSFSQIVRFFSSLVSDFSWDFSSSLAADPPHLRPAAVSIRGRPRLVARWLLGNFSSSDY